MSTFSISSKTQALKPRGTSSPHLQTATSSSSSELVKQSLEENLHAGQSSSSRSLAKRTTITKDVDSLSEHFGRLEIPSSHGKKQRTPKSSSNYDNFSCSVLPYFGSCPDVNENKTQTRKTERKTSSSHSTSSSSSASSSSSSSSSSIASEKKQRTSRFETDTAPITPFSDERASSSSSGSSVVESSSSSSSSSSIASGKKQRTSNFETNLAPITPFSDERASSSSSGSSVVESSSSSSSSSSVASGKKQRTSNFETNLAPIAPFSDERASSSSSESSSSSSSSSSIASGKKQRTLTFETHTLPITPLSHANRLACGARKKMLNRQYDSALEDFQLAFQAFFSEKDPQSRIPGTLSPSHALSDYVPPHVIKDAGFCYYKLNQFEASSRLYDQTLAAYKKRNVSISPKVYGMAGLCQLLSGQSENAYPFFERAAKQALLVPGWIWARAAHRFLEMGRFAEVSGFSARAQSSYEFQKKKIPLDYWEPAITAAVKVGRSNAFVIGLVEKALFAFRCHNIKPPQSLFISGMHVYLKMGDLEKALELSHLSVQHL